ncbi:uncharacterized protein LOC123556414 [Mercenaria mercenaria]|uniref:uncharacterized protein LOC123556414 n=1 Tax=Mercenaria mercenaria TaxID=6596 RepID=UPI00234E87D6|nr:uncharacterized protein LOC123556414 [Mercenaria mercenaria]
MAEGFIHGCKGRLTLATTAIKIATVTLFIVLIVHTVGFALPYWLKVVSIRSNIVNSSIDIESTEFLGLWKDCLCGNITGMSECNCFTKDAFAGSLRTTQILETVGIVGLATSGILSIILVCLRQRDKILKVINIMVSLCSGVCIMVGVVIFERETFDRVTLQTSSSEQRSSLTTSFILCTIAAGLCIFCVPLLVIDLFNRGRPERHELQLIHVENKGQEQFITRQKQPQLPPTNIIQEDDMLP